MDDAAPPATGSPATWETRLMKAGLALRITTLSRDTLQGSPAAWQPGLGVLP